MNASRICMAVPFLLMGMGLIGFWHRCVVGGKLPSVIGSPRAAEHPVTFTGVAERYRFPVKVATASASNVQPPATDGATAVSPPQAGQCEVGLATGINPPAVMAAAKAEEPPNQNDSPIAPVARFPIGPARSFTIPKALAERPLPVFIRFSGVVAESDIAGAGTLLPPLPGVAVLPARREQQVLAEAERIFGEAMEQAPTRDTSAPEYEDWWRAAQTRSEDYLRLTLGWDRFNTLSRAELKDLSKPFTANLSPAGDMPSAAE